MNRKWALGIGIVAAVGAVFWLRELASWRPKRVLKAQFSAERLRFSRDGKLLLIQGGRTSAILDLRDNSLDSNFKAIRDFQEKNGLRTFPRLEVGEKGQLKFSSTREQKTPFVLKSSLGLFPANYRGQEFGSWSKLRNEIYCTTNGALWIWNWNDGQLKKRVKLQKPNLLPSRHYRPVFSPDGKWLIELIESKNSDYLCRYDVQTGKLVSLFKQATQFDSLGFSPDGTLIWLSQSGMLRPANSIQVLRLSDSKPLWSAASSGPAKWLPDGRIGIVQNDGFSLRNAAGREIARLPGPLHPKNLTNPLRNISDWAMAPNGQHIYSAEISGLIRRWRAR